MREEEGVVGAWGGGDEIVTEMEGTTCRSATNKEVTLGHHTQPGMTHKNLLTESTASRCRKRRRTCHQPVA